MEKLIILDAAGAGLGLYQLFFVCAAMLSLYSAYTWYEGRRDKNPLVSRRGKLLLLLALVLMLITSMVSYKLTGQLPFLIKNT
ncbi:MAG TPA: hypothetical protein VIK80_13900 [Flavihumibacter sp.]